MAESMLHIYELGCQQRPIIIEPDFEEELTPIMEAEPDNFFVDFKHARNWPEILEEQEILNRMLTLNQILN
jgi:hypothetical protein